jgi:hypothetical protein
MKQLNRIDILLTTPFMLIMAVFMTFLPNSILSKTGEIWAIGTVPYAFGVSSLTVYTWFRNQRYDKAQLLPSQARVHKVTVVPPDGLDDFEEIDVDMITPDQICRCGSFPTYKDGLCESCWKIENKHNVISI